MSDNKNIVERTFLSYRSASSGWYESCYYGLVAEAYYNSKREMPKIDLDKYENPVVRQLIIDFYNASKDKTYDDFQEFDDAYFRHFAGIKPGEPLPLDSNEVFDETYRSHLERWYYIPLNCDSDIYDSVINFMPYVKAGNIEPFTDYYKRGYPFLTE